MRSVGFCIFLLMFGSALADTDVSRAGKSFLTATSFPKTFNDLSFTTRNAVLAAGYEPWESEFDASGRCISGCAYQGITIEEEAAMLARKTEQVRADLQAAGVLPSQNIQFKDKIHQVVSSNMPSAYQPTPSTQPAQPTPTPPTSPQPSQPAVQIASHVSCYPSQPEIPAGQTLPLGEPVTGHPRISSPFGSRIHPVTGNRQNHSGVDLSVPSGTNVFTPASGTVSRVWTDNTCGRGIVINHSGGYQTVYCHLSQQLVSAGDNVGAGCRIGLSGNTGRSTGPHLHYGTKRDGVAFDPMTVMGR